MMMMMMMILKLAVNGGGGGGDDGDDDSGVCEMVVVVVMMMMMIMKLAVDGGGGGGGGDSRDDDESSDAQDESDDNEDFGEILSRIKRSKGQNLSWEFEADMLAAFGKDPELRMKAVCALYRQQTSEGKFIKGSLVNNCRGFNKLDTHRYDAKRICYYGVRKMQFKLTTASSSS
ncbi:hypothetical protein LWI29_030478 [Acer saccharum]|uniref:Uncharacterized protein n=1 Tax=Acer saccharum TaxID=4024 RepID=A0AA39SRT0_ACESA|nr:hypothetical protein LWI29_030478 [Acer saccharum]